MGFGIKTVSPIYDYYFFFFLLMNWLIGVTIGLVLSFYYIIHNNFKEEYKITETVENGIDTFLIKLNSNVFLQ